MSKNKIKGAWQIWMDTGGTFTDCIAISPDKQQLRIKVLSNGGLRGIITKKIGKKQFHFSHNWPIEEDIFKDYKLILLDSKKQNNHITAIDFQSNTLFVKHDFDCSFPIFFELSNQEEAPVLATRIATKTALGAPFPAIDMRLGTTKGTNALLEKKGAKIAFLVTEGFEDLIAIGTQQRPHLFQLNIPAPFLLYQKVIGVAERMSTNGKILKALSKETIIQVIDTLKAHNIEAVAITFLHAYVNPLHELQMATALHEHGFQFISISHQLSPSIQILPRAKTALVNAYLSPIIHQYLQNIQQTLQSNNQKASSTQLKIMTSAGGLMNAVEFQPKDSLLSGPAGGIVGAAAIAKSLGHQMILTLDMGGTSTDTARYDGQFDYQSITEIGDITMASPCLSIETVAAGGGSICYFDGFKLCVGPESAGASPGPACYGAGGPLTITDVNLLLGHFVPDVMGIPIHIKAARIALQELQKDIQLSTDERYTEAELLKGFEKIANEKMADAIRKISVSKGIDPKTYALLVFGGAGGLHACKIAELLNISTVILPYDGGILSALGMGKANIERTSERQILKNLALIETEIPTILQELIETTKATFALANPQINQKLFLKRGQLFLRYQGQSHALSIELPLAAGDSYETIFKNKYYHLFGHNPSISTIEVEKIQVLLSTESIRPAPITPSPNTFQQLPPKNIYLWDELKMNDRINTESIIVNKNATAYVENGWEAEVHSDKNIILTKTKASTQKKEAHKQAIALELFTNRFSAIAEEMGAQLQRTAFSVNIKERLDFSCALLDPEGELLVNAPHIPVHLGSLGICVRLVEEKMPLTKGDIVITNHPKYGGSHLPDVTMMAVIFDNDNQKIGYVVNRAHHAEIGGKTPGSMPPDATNLQEEGVVISPTYFVKNGITQWETIENMLVGSPYPTRSLHENLADINAALASLKIGEKKLRSLVKNEGLEKVHFYMQQLKHHAFTALNQQLKNYRYQKNLSPKEHICLTAKEYLDDQHAIQVSVTITPNYHIEFDFTGTSTKHPNNLNANISIVFSAILYALRLLCQKEIPLNEGLMKNVKILLPENTFLHPQFSDIAQECPAVVGGNTEVSQRLVDTLLKAFEMAACSQGTMNNLLFGNKQFGYYETICGGTGAGYGFHGRSAVHQHMTNTKITDPEELEFRYPVRLLKFAIRQNSGGKGLWQGGHGIIRVLQFLEAVDFTLISQHRKNPPYGLAGGKNGKVGKQLIIRKNGVKENLEGVDQKKLCAGDQVIIKTPGGGGYGIIG